MEFAARFACIYPTTVGEARSLPRSVVPQRHIWLGEFVQRRTRYHSTKHSGIVTWRGAESLPYSECGCYWNTVQPMRFFLKIAPRLLPWGEAFFTYRA